jgi:hypothetical protein
MITNHCIQSNCLNSALYWLPFHFHNVDKCSTISIISVKLIHILLFVFHICFGPLSCILSYRNSINQVAFVQQFLSNLLLPLPSPVSTWVAIKEPSAGRRASAQIDRDRRPEVKYSSIKSATVNTSPRSNSARGLHFCKRYAALQSNTTQSMNS